MTPALTVLQLDTDFPRIAGDVAAPDTYTQPIEVLRVAGAGVGAVVRSDPLGMAIGPFEAALAQARGRVVTTSCGFLAAWQGHLATQTARPFLASALNLLPELAGLYAPDELQILTFDRAALTAAHFGAETDYAQSVWGLPDTCELRRVIRGNLGTLDRDLAERELIACARESMRPRTRAFLLECTNFPPYARALRAALDRPVFSVLTGLETLSPGLVQPEFLNGTLY